MALLKTFWHLPDQFHWMGALPLPHRRWVLIATMFILLVILWPYTPPNTPIRPVPVHIAQHQVMQAELVDNRPITPPPSTENSQLHHYRIVEGQTLAQLFRQHNLPVEDVFAMAQSEGEDKPLSSLQPGQRVDIEQNAQGMVTSLVVETGTNSSVRFVRQADGSYSRLRN
ncbi:LysM-like peptidoglycan-binding domain-containing protein [Acerihabitans sp. TG2]|uniref:OapA family protein n=1 Tax=Acerihabitans sp. TG2 TaxID=3096008 RepID=UPI002B22B0F7|nr:LysM-like peptidoglycan-binding domain-containing protein [Acerihabitans sp. TG2]MEA9393084.1 LysM-like peptidoglycan-binding domain-containing protein [Acerihabitans sp. TG2]